MIKIKPAEHARLLEATCDICGVAIATTPGYTETHLGDHLKIGGRHNGKILEAIVCIKCMEEKLSFINIQRHTSAIGHC